jgi:1-acyl-sn-glycerol-3-phosphate acyltransferase
MKLFYRICWLIARIYFRIFCRLEIIGEENIPKTGAVIIAANHLSAADPPIVSISVKREVYFLAKKELFNNFLLRNLITNLNSIPVNRGILDRRALGAAEEALKRGYGLILFPEGTRSKTGDLRKGKPGVGLLARRYLVPIVPTFIENSPGFWKLIFMGKRLKVRFGELFDTESIGTFSDDNDGYRSIAENLMTKIAILANSEKAKKAGK